MNPWLFIILGGLFETGWALTIKLSDGFTEPVWLIPTLILLVISMYLLNKGLHNGLPAGPAYIVWVGIGAVGSIILGVVLFNDVLTFAKAVFLAMILIGVFGIEYSHEKSE